MNIFKPSKIQNWKVNWLRTLAQTAVFWFVFLVALPFAIHQLEQQYLPSTLAPMPVLGGVLLLIWSGLGLWSGYAMSRIGQGTPLPLECANKLVVVGPYRFVRNPMALAGIGQGVAVGFIIGSLSVVLYALCGAFLWHYLVRPSEERDLTQRFGDAYVQYKQAVKCWWIKF